VTQTENASNNSPAKNAKKRESDLIFVHKIISLISGVHLQIGPETQPFRVLSRFSRATFFHFESLFG